MFPKTAVQSEWLEKLDFWCNSPQVDLFYMIIVKSSVNNHETVCVPRIYNKSANRMMFKLQSSHHVMERNFFKPQQKKYKNFNQNQQMKQSNKFTRTGRK